MKYLYLFLFIAALGCKKAADKDPYIVICFFDDYPEWFDKAIQDNRNCACQTEYLRGNWNKQTIYEIRVTDPLCNSENLVYDESGKILVRSSNTASYKSYRDNVTKLVTIWKCNKDI